MIIKTLVENTAVSKEYNSVHGLSFYIETSAHKILFDVGPNSLLLENTERMGVDLAEVDTVVISHGHKDHGGALRLFLDKNKQAKVYIRETAFDSYYVKVLGIPFSVGLDSTLKNNPQVVLTGESLKIDNELQLFSGVMERECYCKSNNTLYMKSERGLINDTFGHEQSLIVTEDEKTMLFAGCAHSGIINIQNKSERLIGKPLTHVISGFHLYNPASLSKKSDNTPDELARRIKDNSVKYYTCHCTGVKIYSDLKAILGDKIEYLAAGSILEL